ncbi:hypothetical protein [Halomonas sp. RT37]|uniref:Uncharacterized protein n=1 Tax=Halomonas sp. RT37 TaxID=2950872 RepID=A0AAU7KDC4_9GAMM
MKNADMPAMPLDSQAEGDIAQGYRYSHTGLTKREHFAALAMNGLMSMDIKGRLGPRATAAGAVKYADALLEALEDS